MLTCIKTEDRSLAIDTRTEDSLSVEEISSVKPGLQTESWESGYTFFGSGKLADEPGTHSIGFAIKMTLLCKLPYIPQVVDEHLMTDPGSAYAPTLSVCEWEHNLFYLKLQTVVSKIPYHNKILLMGDFNARIGNKHTGVMGQEQRMKADYDCCPFVNSLMQRLSRQMMTTKTPGSILGLVTGRLLDCVIMKNKDYRDFRLTKTRKTPECYLDHGMVCSKVFVKPKGPLRSIQELEQTLTLTLRVLYDNVEGIIGSRKDAPELILSLNRTKHLSSKDEILKRWAEHFKSLLNQESTNDPEVINEILQQPIIEELVKDLWKR
uniref:Endonuclease/exonuclease/phosphatase domain-containing protein n=1 Tax=Octopus bimaculoides TaxID=37653 RepID=A0A0L8I2S3_OCTBM